MNDIATPTIDYDAFRQEVREFLTANYTQQMRDLNSRQAGLFAEPSLALKWQKIVADKGWSAPSWPKQYGGPGWDAIQRNIYETECAAVDTPQFANQGISLVAPAIMRYATQEQKDFFLPRILTGEHYFCQGFSEPGAGSDLASLRTEAVRDGDDYVINGSKIWTTHAHNANWIFFLARTSNEGKKQQGISFFIAPMSTPGISVRPIISISGEHELNQTFFDNVRVPASNLIGEENRGWEVSKYLLEFERGNSQSAPGLSMIERAKWIAKAQPSDDDANLWEDRAFRRRVCELEIDLLALAATEHAIVSSLTAGDSIGNVTAAIIKVTGTIMYQQATELCVEALGDYGMADQRDCLILSSNTPPIGPTYAAKPTAKFLNARAASIYAGANEVLKNVIAREMVTSA